MPNDKFADIEDPANRLRALVKKTLNGGCKMLSQGGGCQCGLCDIDRLARLAYVGSRAESAVMSALMGWKEKV